MKTILVVGIGTGSAEHVTVAAIEALNRADVLFIPDKGAGKSDLADVRRTIIARHVLRPDPRQIGYAVPRRDAQSADYGQGVADWHRSLADIYAMLISDVPENGTGAFLVWGDPGSTISRCAFSPLLPNRSGSKSFRALPPFRP